MRKARSIWFRMIVIIIALVKVGDRVYAQTPRQRCLDNVNNWTPASGFIQSGYQWINPTGVCGSFVVVCRRFNASAGCPQGQIRHDPGIPEVIGIREDRRNRTVAVAQNAANNDERIRVWERNICRSPDLPLP